MISSLKVMFGCNMPPTNAGYGGIFERTVFNSPHVLSEGHEIDFYYFRWLFVHQARAPKALVPKEGAEDEEDDAAIQAEVQAMLDSIKRKGEDTDSDDDSEGDAEADALRYSEVEKTGPKEGKDSVAALLDAGVDVHDVGEDVELPEEKEESHAKPAKARSAKKAAPAATPSSSM